MKRHFIQLSVCKPCNLKSSFLYYFKIYLALSFKNHVKEQPCREKIHQTLYHVPNSDQQGMDPTTYYPRFFPQFLTELSPEQETVFCIKVPSGFSYHFNSCKTCYRQCCVAKKSQSLITTGNFYYSELSRC